MEIAEPGRLVGEFRAALEGKDVKGRIYLSEQGLNSQFGGRREDAMAFAEWVAAHPLFQVGGGATRMPRVAPCSCVQRSVMPRRDYLEG